MKIESGTIIRLVLLVLALANQILSMLGYPVLPIADEQVESVVSVLFTVVVSLVAYWKNNSFTKPAIEADKLLKEMKEVEKTPQGVSK